MSHKNSTAQIDVTKIYGAALKKKRKRSLFVYLVCFYTMVLERSPHQELTKWNKSAKHLEDKFKRALKRHSAAVFAFNSWV